MPSARIRVNSHLRPYETSPSPAIQDISVSGHTRHLRLRPYKTSPSPVIRDSSPAETCICNTSCFAFRHSEVCFVNPLSCNCQCASSVCPLSAQLNFTSRSPFYDIENTHGGAVLKMLFIHNCSLNIEDIVNLRL
jgi:hypothetical protein